MVMVLFQFMGFTIAQLAYLAAILDGEGTISICDKRVKDEGKIRKTKKIYRARVNFSTTVTVCNTNPKLIEWLVSVFGGGISHTKRQKENWKPKITWIMPTKKIAILLEGALPYFVLKKEQAKLMIEARKTFDENPKALLTSDEVYNRRLEISKLIRFHNQNILPPCLPTA